MAEILKFSDFKKKSEAARPENVQTGENRRINLLRLTDLLRLVTKLMAGVNDPRGRAYQARYELVKTYTDEEIIWRINGFNELEVNSKPLFYSALIDTARERGLYPSNPD